MYYYINNLSANDKHVFKLLMHAYQNISDQPRNNMECVKIYLLSFVNNKKSYLQ